MQTEISTKQSFVSDAQSTVNDFAGTVQQQAQSVINEIQGVKPTILQVTDNTEKASNKIEDNQDTVIFFSLENLLLIFPIDFNNN